MKDKLLSMLAVMFAFVAAWLYSHRQGKIRERQRIEAAQNKRRAETLKTAQEIQDEILGLSDSDAAERLRKYNRD